MTLIDTGVSLCALISNYMHLAQVFQVEKDVKITCSPSHQVTCFPSNNKNPKSAENEELKHGVSRVPSHDISYGQVKTLLGKQVISRI